jgi:hypothetical protein
MAMDRRVVFVSAMWMGLYAGLALAEGNPVARIGNSGKVLELEQRVNGRVVKHDLPLHQAGGVRYFSAGVGLEERTAVYPPFPLKLVFTAGGKPFLVGVDVTIQPVEGGAAIRIAREQVDGPWLFVDLPSGTYDIAASQAGRTQGLKGIEVEVGKQKTVHLRWAEDAGLAGQLTKE